MIPVNEIVCGHNVDVLAGFPAECIDLTVTSPPYDNLRTYKGFTFDFEGIAQQLYRVTKQGGVVVWVVADATIDGSETGTSFRQALRFMEIGFKLHDTMIYERENPMPGEQPRYCQAFEYMFVFSKNGHVAFNPVTTRANKAGQNKTSQTARTANGGMKLHTGNGGKYQEFKKINNVWRYGTGYMLSTTDTYAHQHPAMFPEKLAQDHILSWSNPDDIVLDPFAGSGTTAKMAIRHHRRYIGIDVSAEYCELARRRIAAVQPTLFDVVAV